MRLLIVTGEAVSDVAYLPGSVRTLVEGASEIFVVTPNLPGRLQWLTNDTDATQQLADGRLDVVLGQVKSIDPEATGQVGADDPLTAFGDAIRTFGPDHILIGLRAADHAGWQESGLLDAVVAGFHLPTTVFEIDSSGRSA